MVPIDIVIPTTSPDVAWTMLDKAMKYSGHTDVTAHVILDAENRGAVKTANIGMHRTTSHVLLMNDDVMPITDKWLAKLLNVLGDYPDSGYVGPSGKCRTEPMASAKGVTDDMPQVVDMHPFFCTLIRREVLEVVGHFDEAYKHYGFDQEHQWKAQRHGWKSYWHPGVWVDHTVSGWTQREPAKESLRQQWKEQDQKLLTERWG